MQHVVAILKVDFDLRHEVYKIIHAYSFKQVPETQAGVLKSIGWTIGPMSYVEADLLKNHLLSLTSNMRVNLVSLR